MSGLADADQLTPRSVHAPDALRSSYIAEVPVGARAEFSISAARIAEGHLIVMGQVDEPNTDVSLDDVFTEPTDGSGRFTFRPPAPSNQIT